VSAPAALAAVVLAGGASRRMGRDKATMPHPRHPSMTMLEYTVSVLSARCAPVFVVAAPGQALPDLTGTVDVRILRDDVRGAGPLPATGRGLRAAATAGAARAFVSAVDLPNLTVETVDVLAGYRDVDVVLPWDGRDHYLAGVYRTALADRIEELIASGERRMRALADIVLTQRVVLAQNAALVNLNTPGDLC
jgi:molybdopterin-guanine dinucleotide biosynthesis protein A